jgi:hypothetical protein
VLSPRVLGAAAAVTVAAFGGAFALGQSGGRAADATPKAPEPMPVVGPASAGAGASKLRKADPLPGLHVTRKAKPKPDRSPDPGASPAATTTPVPTPSATPFRTAVPTVVPTPAPSNGNGGGGNGGTGEV